MKKPNTANKILLFLAILMTSCSIAKTQDNATVKIGTQNWMSKNLNVSTYRNGDIIPQVQDSTKWVSLKTGAWCYYENKEENGKIYGKLYNWYAVSDPRGLAPSGYHIPSDAEWTILTDYLGGTIVAGKKMKNTSGWLKNGNGTNESGFAALPGSSRYKGSFSGIGSCGFWWSSTEYSTGLAWYRVLNNWSVRSTSSAYSERDGYSVRCLRD